MKPIPFQTVFGKNQTEKAVKQEEERDANQQQRDQEQEELQPDLADVKTQEQEDFQRNQPGTERKQKQQTLSPCRSIRERPLFGRFCRFTFHLSS